MSEVAAQFEKQDGKLVVSADGRTVSWTPNNGTRTVGLAIAEIANLQQTGPNAKRASIKIAIENPTSKKTDWYQFTFTSATARDDQQATTSPLRQWIEAAKSQTAPPPVATPASNGGSSSAAMAIAQAVVGAAEPADDTLDDAKLLADHNLQSELLANNDALRKRFQMAYENKPDTITLTQFTNHFWVDRVRLLRAYTVEKSQRAGTYNVLSVVKPVSDGGSFKLNMSKEQIQLIFSQHPRVKNIYNKNVPNKLSEGTFWSRFFTSRLVKKLRGEKINDENHTDPILDQDLNLDDDVDDAPLLDLPSVPRFLDVEGNEQNHSQRLGNRPDMTMRPDDKIPILRVLNRMSEKMMAKVPPSDADPHAPVGADEETYKELQLRDLQRAADDNRIVLNLQDQSRFFSAGQGVHTSSSAAAYAKRTPAQVLSTMQQDFLNISTGKDSGASLNLHAAIGIDDESSSDEDGPAQKKSRVGSRSSRTAATSQIVKAIKKSHLHDDDYLSFQIASSTDQAAKLGVPDHVFKELEMTHNATVEFLHYFWAVYHSGDPDRANEVGKLIETLSKSLDRIQAVTDTAENERLARVDVKKKEIDMIFQRTGKKRKFDPNNIKGGAKAVNTMVQPLVRAIKSAKEQYETELHQQTRSATHLTAT